MFWVSIRLLGTWTLRENFRRAFVFLGDLGLYRGLGFMTHFLRAPHAQTSELVLVQIPPRPLRMLRPEPSNHDCGTPACWFVEGSS